MTIKKPLIYNFFGKSNELQLKWVNLFTYDMRTSKQHFKNFDPPPVVSRGSKGSKIWKKHVFLTKSISGAKTVSCAHFFITDSERGIFGREIPQKKIMGSTSGKNSYGRLKIFFWKKRTIFFGHPKIGRLKTITTRQISPKILFIVPKS